MNLLTASTLEWVFFGIGTLHFFQWFYLINECVAFKNISLKLEKNKSTGQLCPKVSVIFTARDEEKYISSCLESLVHQNYKNLEVIAVNDRSKDNTGLIISKFAKKYEVIKPLSISTLPSGWLGKNNALQKAADIATGDLILFTDADVFFESHAISTAVKWVQGNQLDHLVLSPKLKSDSLILSALQTYFSLMFVLFTRPSQIGKTKKHYIGAGAFNMLTREAYNKIDGHKKLRLEVLDDVMLGKLIVSAGFKQAVLSGRELLSLNWYDSTWDMIKGLEKNGFAALRFSLLKLVGLIFFTGWLHILPYTSLFFLNSVGLYAIATSLIFAHLFFLLVIIKLGHKWWLFLLMSPAALILCFTHIRSTCINLKNRSITWRETSYSLKELKKHCL